VQCLTGDEGVIIEEFLVLDAGGDIVARKIRILEGYGCAMVDWPGYRPAMKLKLCSEGRTE
jgi:hypothetical protein